MSSFNEWVREQRNIEDGWGREYPSPVSADMSNISDHDNSYWITDEADRMVGISASVSNPWQSHNDYYDSMFGEIVPTNTGCLATVDAHDCDWQLSIDDALGNKYKEMEKRVEEQDKTISELKSIIEDLQGIVYKKKLDKEAETLVL